MVFISCFFPPGQHPVSGYSVRYISLSLCNHWRAECPASLADSAVSDLWVIVCRLITVKTNKIWENREIKGGKKGCWATTWHKHDYNPIFTSRRLQKPIENIYFSRPLFISEGWQWPGGKKYCTDLASSCALSVASL